MFNFVLDSKALRREQYATSENCSDKLLCFSDPAGIFICTGDETWYNEWTNLMQTGLLLSGEKPMWKRFEIKSAFKGYNFFCPSTGESFCSQFYWKKIQLTKSNPLNIYKIFAI